MMMMMTERLQTAFFYVAKAMHAVQSSPAVTAACAAQLQRARNELERVAANSLVLA